MVTPEVGGCGVGVDGAEEVPPPHAIRPKLRSAAVMAGNKDRPFVRGIDEERVRTDGIKVLRYK